MDNSGQNTMLTALAAILGFVVGLFIFGWWLTPPGFRDAGPEHLEGLHLDYYVQGLNAMYGASNNSDLLRHALCYDDDFEAVNNRLAALNSDTENPNPALAGQYDSVVNIVNGDGGCETFRTNNPPQDAGLLGGSLGTLLSICLGALILLGLIGLLYYLMRQRSANGEVRSDNFERAEPREEARSFSRPKPEPEERPAAVAPPPPRLKPAQQKASSGGPTPLAGFQTTYIRGDDNFDKSFIIENANGDFLGECGVSISESIGNTDSTGTRNVTAYEIWLFDKNDTHTVTRVIMSDHAYNDEGFLAKLATRGEPMLAQFDETVALETKSLIINAEVTEIEYADQDPARSTFERFTVELSAWVKGENSTKSDDDILNF